MKKFCKSYLLKVKFCDILKCDFVIPPIIGTLVFVIAPKKGWWNFVIHSPHCFCSHPCRYKGYVPNRISII